MAQTEFMLIKGDTSGIQHFIFNTQSKGAAKALKGRSFYVEMTGWLAEHKIKEMFPDAQTIYNGGGNLYIKINKDKWNESLFYELQQQLQQHFIHSTLSFCLSFTEYTDTALYGDCLKDINAISRSRKLSIFNHIKNGHSFFQTFSDNSKVIPIGNETSNGQLMYKTLTENLARSISYSIGKKNNGDNTETYLKAATSLFGYSVLLSNNVNGDGKRLPKHLPLWNQSLLTYYSQIITDRMLEEERTQTDKSKAERPYNNTIIEFDYLADFAKERTGTDKLGILKLDIDNLGSLFQQIKDEANNRKLSDKLIWFFNTHLNNLLDKKFIGVARKCRGNEEVKCQKTVQFVEKSGMQWKSVIKSFAAYELQHQQYRYGDNLYVVFAGGDDCFVIGAWDAIIEFAMLLQKEFTAYETNNIRKELSFITAPVTLSAAVIIVDAHFPVVKFAALAEEQLHKAKTYTVDSKVIDGSGKPMKNKINFMGRVFTWEQLKEVVAIKNKFQNMILEYGEAKAFLQRIIDSFENEDGYYWQTKNKPFNPAILWRFLYDYRDIRNKDYFKGVFYNYFFGDPREPHIGGIYEKHLVKAFTEGNTDAQFLPVAARWAEFLTRKNSTNG